MGDARAVVQWWDGWVQRWVRTVRARLLVDDLAQDRVAAAGTFAVGVVFIFLGLTDLWPTLDDAPDSHWWHLAPLAVGTLAMLIKRNHPMSALGIGLVALAPDVWLGGSAGMIFVLYDLLFAATLFGTSRDRKVVAGGVASGLAVAFVWSEATGQELRTTAFLVLQLFAILVTPIWWATNVRQKTELIELAAERAELERSRSADLQALAELRQEELVREERTRMARDLHDVIAGYLSAIAIHAEAALADHPDQEADRATLRHVRQGGIDALEEMRSMILLLRSGAEPVASAAGLARLDELLETARAAALDVEVVQRTPSALPAAVDQAAFRIVQESLTNAAKHSPGCTASVGLSVAGDALDVVVENSLEPTRRSAVSAGASVRGGTGLVIMRERAEALGGTFEAGPYDVTDQRAGRWRVRAVLPLGSAP